MDREDMQNSTPARHRVGYLRLAVYVLFLIPGQIRAEPFGFPFIQEVQEDVCQQGDRENAQGLIQGLIMHVLGE